MEIEAIKYWCRDNVNKYVLAHTKDGYCCDGILEHIDDECICLAVPHCGGEGEQYRAFGPYPYYPFFGTPFAVPPLYPYPFYPRRRFIRRVFPLATLLGLSLLPYY